MLQSILYLQHNTQHQGLYEAVFVMLQIRLLTVPAAAPACTASGNLSYQQATAAVLVDHHMSVLLLLVLLLLLLLLVLVLLLRCCCRDHCRGWCAAAVSWWRA
jgi:hypothetical protein